MSQADAVAFLERVESDEDFTKELESVKENPDAVVEKVRAAGFDATPDEIREAFADRYGVELAPEQLDRVAAGLSDAEIGMVVGGTVGGAVIIATVAFAAAV
jgi:predicted ribosomally synthesized peptide with nif11-like leader